MQFLDSVTRRRRITCSTGVVVKSNYGLLVNLCVFRRITCSLEKFDLDYEAFSKWPSLFSSGP